MVADLPQAVVPRLSPNSTACTFIRFTVCFCGVQQPPKRYLMAIFYPSTQGNTRGKAMWDLFFRVFRLVVE